MPEPDPEKSEWELMFQCPKPIGIVKGIFFTVDKNECLGLVGANGAGKSTILKILSGMLFPDYGNAYVKSKSMTSTFQKRKVTLLVLVLLLL